MPENVAKVSPPLPVKDQLTGAKKRDRERRPPMERFALQTFGQLVPGIQAAKGLVERGEMPPATVIQAAGALNAALGDWFNQS